MAPSSLHLPDGQTITVTSIFNGLYFRNNDLNTHHHSQLPPGWTIVLHSEDEDEDDCENSAPVEEPPRSGKSHVHRYRKPTLHNDALFISSISNPSSTDFKPAVSPTRQIAMMLWATLWWYFHQPRPASQLLTSASSKTTESGRPRGEWRIRIKREGIFKGRNLLSKLERMGLIASEQSCVGAQDEKSGGGWMDMFASQRAFWQIDARIFLFTLTPTGNSPFPPASPFTSRPGSPSRDSGVVSPRYIEERSGQGLWSSTTPGPFTSSSHLPTYYPPPPPQYVFSKSIRHPLRPKPPHQSETFYTRYVPSFGQYLSFRVASLSNKHVVHNGPVGPTASPSVLPLSSTTGVLSTARLLSNMILSPCDTEILHAWMNNPRVSAFWGIQGDISVQEEFLRAALNSHHSFPIIGCWDGKPFGYFEIYWVKEDQLGAHYNGGDIGEWDRGIHVLIGEEEFRGKERVKVWLSALVHYCWLADSRTMRVLAEPRVDNERQGPGSRSRLRKCADRRRFIKYLQECGFYKEKEISFPYKQSALMKITREAWDSPFL